MSARRDWRGYRVLDAFAVVCAVLTVIMLVWPATTIVVPAEIRLPPTGGASSLASSNTGATIESVRYEIVRTNAFSASRKAPTARFVAPGSEPTPPMPSTLDAGAGAFAPADVGAGPRLFGIVSVDGSLRALLQARSASEPPRLLGVGESSGGVRVVRIGRDRVVISSSSGTRTLRLSRVVPDSSENEP
ncbi:hypothetical protein [Gemmatimonas sp.]|uniref:hypothetical protein n=1 Tax=Gemmatimonas sp. TaxID=1962908 RepID=UPI0039832E21